MNGLWRLNEGKYIAEKFVQSDGSALPTLSNGNLKVTLFLNGVSSVLNSGSHSLLQINSSAYLLTITSGIVNSAGDANLFIEPKAGIDPSLAFDPMVLKFRAEANDLDSIRVALDLEIATLSSALRGQLATLSSGLNSKLNSMPANVWANPARIITGMTLSAVKNLLDTNKSTFTAVNSIGKLLVDNITASLSAVLAKCLSGNSMLGQVKGVGFVSTDSLVNIKAAIAALPSTTLTYAKIVSAILNASRASYQATGSIGEVFRFVASYTTGRRFYNASTGQEEMYDGVSTLLKQFDITLDTDGKLVDRSPV